MPRASGAAQVRETFAAMMATPGVSVKWEPTKAEVSTSGDVGYTTGAYESMANGVPDKGKYVTVWQKLDGQWKVAEDIFNSDSGPAPTSHVMMAPASLKWTDPPPGLPPGSKIAVISGDPSKAAPFVIRAQVPAGYRVLPHWHPGDENLTILSGTVALGMGETWDDATLQSLSAGGFAAMPAGMRHFFMARTAATFQVHGMGPFAVNYVNPSDDPSLKR
jgi:quercetin dioxygenase-like cupin family protein